jgi:hypothetical protein
MHKARQPHARPRLPQTADQILHELVCLVRAWSQSLPSIRSVVCHRRPRWFQRQTEVHASHQPWSVMCSHVQT